MAQAIVLGIIGADPSVTTDSLDALDGASMVGPINGPNVDASIVTPSIVSLAAGSGALIRHFIGDYYFRIWVVPPLLRILNPKLGVQYPFHVWNAFPWNNDLNTIGGTGQTGLTLDLVPVSTFGEIEYRLVNVVIDATAPNEISAHYVFTFDDGVGLFDLIGVLATFMDLIPDAPATEFWDWLTDIIESHNAKEQRIAIRSGPKFSMQSEFMLEGELERRYRYQKWYLGMSAGVIVPYLQYSAFVTVAAAVGATKVFFNPARTDLRDGGYVIFLDSATGLGQLAQADTVDLDGVTLAAPLGDEVRVGSLVAPGYPSRLADASGPSMFSVTGHLRIDSQMLGIQNVLVRPGSAPSIPTLNGLSILDRRPLADTEVDENFDVGNEIIDSDVGMMELRTAWPHPYIAGARRFLVHRVLEPGEMDWWRVFLDSLNGMQNPFLFSTYREDLLPDSNPGVGSLQLDIVEEGYVANYFPYGTYKYLRIETGGGVLFRRVLTAVDNGDGTATLELDAAFGSGFTNIQRISFLNLSRLGSDRVKWIHGPIDSVVEIVVRTIDA